MPQTHQISNSGVRPSSLCFNMPSRGGFCCTRKLEKHRHRRKCTTDVPNHLESFSNITVLGSRSILVFRVKGHSHPTWSIKKPVPQRSKTRRAPRPHRPQASRARNRARKSPPFQSTGSLKCGRMKKRQDGEATKLKMVF